MKKFIVFLFCFLAGLPAFGKDKPYVRLVIEEVKKDKEFKFSLKEAEVIFGDCDHFVRIFEETGVKNKTEYVLATYNSKHELIENYVIPSGRFIFWDGEENGKKTGGLIESEKGEMDVLVPFDKNNPASFFIVKNLTREKSRVWKFTPLPVKKLLEQCSAIEKKIAEKEKR